MTVFSCLLLSSPVFSCLLLSSLSSFLGSAKECVFRGSASQLKSEPRKYLAETLVMNDNQTITILTIYCLAKTIKLDNTIFQNTCHTSDTEECEQPSPPRSGLGVSSPTDI